MKSKKNKVISLGVGGLFESPVLFRLFDEKRGEKRQACPLFAF